MTLRSIKRSVMKAEQGFGVELLSYILISSSSYARKITFCKNVGLVWTQPELVQLP